MYDLRQRILAFILSISVALSFFVTNSITSHASQTKPIGGAWATIEEMEKEENSWNWEQFWANLVTTLLCGISDFSAIKDGDFEQYIANNRAWCDTLYGNAKSDGMLSEVYVEQGKDLDSTSVKCSTAFIDWLCKELNAYYVSVNKENISDYYDKTKGVYDYGSTNEITYDEMYGRIDGTKVGVRHYEKLASGRTLAYKNPIYGLLYEKKHPLTGVTYYMADLYIYDPLLADKSVEYRVQGDTGYVTLQIQAVKNGLSLTANSKNYNAMSAGIPYIYGGYGVNSVYTSAYIMENGTTGDYAGGSDQGNYIGFYRLTSVMLSFPGYVAKEPLETFSTWKYSNLQLRTKIPFFDSYEKLEKAYKTGDLTEAVNFSRLSAFAGGYSGDDVTLDSETLKAIEKILNDTSLDIQDKIDQIGDLIGGAIGDNTEEIKKTNSWLARIKAVLDDILGTLKSIRRWTIADTIIDAIDAIVDGADFVKNIITDIINVGINIVKAPGSAFGSILDTVETLGEILKVKFPFCIPWDIAFLVGIFSAAPRVPHYEIPIKYGGAGSIIQIDEMIVIDFTEFSSISRLCRTFLFVIFCKGLLDLTIKIVNMKEGEYDRS